MKKAIIATALILVTLVSCKKEKKEDILTVDLASKIVGEFIGSGTTKSGSTFVQKTIKVTKMSNTRIKITPDVNIGGQNIEPFEIEIMDTPNGITSTVAENDVNRSLAYSNDNLAFDADGQDFGGMRK